jgi:hypothetical protein
MKKGTFLWIGFSAILLGPMFFIACTRQTSPGALNRPTGGTSDRGMMGMMGSGSMHDRMGSATQDDMNVYMDMFNHHTEITRSVQAIPNGIRTITESHNPRLTALLQAHVTRMYEHVVAGQEVRCMSSSLPTMFHNASRYRRHLTLTRKGVAVEETSSDPRLVRAIHEHAREITGFVKEGMPAMMRTMMQ